MRAPVVCVACLVRTADGESAARAAGWELWAGGGRCPVCRGRGDAPPLVDLWVPGIAETKGSWVPLGGGRMKRDNPREHAWAQAVAWAAKFAMRGRSAVDDRVLADLEFHLPPRVDRTKKNQRDIDKAVRSVLDALSQRIVYADDEQVDVLVARKILAPDPATQGARIRVEAIGAPR